ncbi:MAG TPA: NAD(P)-dependent alcohol dehydrogenase [Candidatus Limnocylindria bacterium]|nr:NAD(P)-dependent alcohol dehydrogenase [Candidatus Limnocylindria bacterium]
MGAAAAVAIRSGETMKAIVQEGYGEGALQLREMAKPDVGDDRILIRVRAASVNALDWHTFHGARLMGIIGFVMRSGPSVAIRGVDVAGVVEAVGKDVTRFRPGDEVCGCGRGTLAEYCTTTEGRIVKKPPQLTFQQAATMGVAPITALQGLRDRGQLKPGQRVLIYGGGGGVGTFAVQIAKALGAHVTAVTGPRTVELVRSLGADLVIDYTTEDVARRPERYDLIFDVAAIRPFRYLRRMLAPHGRIVLAGGAKGSFIGILARALTGIIRAKLGSAWLVPFMAAITYDDLSVLKAMVEAGTLRPAIDREFPLTGGGDAITYLGTGQARAKVVVNVS